MEKEVAPILQVEKSVACRSCSAQLFEIVSCRQCGKPWLDAFDRITGRVTPPDRDEFAAASTRETDADKGEEDETSSAPQPPGDGRRRLLVTRAIEGLLRTEVDPLTGLFPEKRGLGRAIWIDRYAEDGCCPRCHAAPSASGGKPLWPFPPRGVLPDPERHSERKQGRRE